MDATKDSSSSLRDKLGFMVWGIRHLDMAIIMAFSTMGALMAIGEWDTPTLIKLALFTPLNYLFVAHVFIFNDWCDAALNPEEPNLRSRHALKHTVLSNRQVLWLSLIVAALALAGFFLISARLFAVGAVLLAATMAYSHPRINFKGRPLINTMIHFIGGCFYFLLGWRAFGGELLPGLALGTFFGLVLSGGHYSNEIDDFDADFAAGIRTNAIAYGKRKVFRVGLLLFVISSVYLQIISLVIVEPKGLMPGYFFIGSVLLVAWIIQSWRYRSWKGGDPVNRFRSFYRIVYALTCAALILIKILEWFTETTTTVYPFAI